MIFNPRVHHRRSIRLPEWNYAWAGAYFITMCTKGRECALGTIVDGTMILDEPGKIVNESWQWLEVQYPHVSLDDFTIMPDHLHGIIIINESRRGGSRSAPEMGGSAASIEKGGSAASIEMGGSRTAPTEKRRVKPLGRLIGAFKTVSTKRINEIRGTPGAIFWQRNYFEHIIRTDDDLNRIRAYIAHNVEQWALNEAKTAGHS
jgi:putative transposase